MILWLYRIFTSIGFPLILLFLLYRKYIGKEHNSRFFERFACSKLARPEGKLLWFHAVSVGEVNSIIPLIVKIKAIRPELNILFTTSTLNSAQIVVLRLEGHVIHQFSPIDSWPVIKLFLYKWKPDLAIWVESEFWPNMIFETNKTCEIILVNARISHNSFLKWLKHKEFCQAMLENFSLILPQSQKTEQYLKILGAKNVKYLGNIKYASPPLPSGDFALKSVQKMISRGRRIFIAASTHDKEEQVICDVHQGLRKIFPDFLTIIVPRDPSRSKEIIQMIKEKGLSLAIRSQNEDITDVTDIYLADTIGELGIFYRLSDIAFIGGSLINKGGHNPLEAARLNCAVMFGPNTFNFTEVCEQLVNEHAAKYVKDANDMKEHLQKLFGNVNMLTEFQENAKRVAENNNEILDETIKIILKRI